MRKILLAATASVALVSAFGSLSDRADAMSLNTQTAVREAAEGTNLTQDVRWVCRYNAWGRRHCWWEPRWRRHWRHGRW